MKLASPLKDISLWFLLVTNLLVILIAVYEGWSLLQLLWVYWMQSVIIGVFHFFKILYLKNFSTEGVKFNRKPLANTPAAKIKVALFFAVHYGIFHFAYFGFLSAKTVFGAVGAVNFGYILLFSIFFLINHGFSAFYNKKRDEERAKRKKVNIGSVMFFPYARVIPMHIIIIFGTSLGNASLILFLALKTLADLLMHVITHFEYKEIHA